jgi:glyoxylate/hydroxypyruvate reductase A
MDRSPEERAMAFLFNSTPERARVFASAFARALPDLPFTDDPDATAAADVQYLLTWTASADLDRYENLEMTNSRWIGSRLACGSCA